MDSAWFPKKAGKRNGASASMWSYWIAPTDCGRNRAMHGGAETLLRTKAGCWRKGLRPNGRCSSPTISPQRPGDRRGAGGFFGPTGLSGVRRHGDRGVGCRRRDAEGRRRKRGRRHPGGRARAGGSPPATRTNADGTVQLLPAVRLSPVRGLPAWPAFWRGLPSCRVVETPCLLGAGIRRHPTSKPRQQVELRIDQLSRSSVISAGEHDAVSRSSSNAC